MTPEEPSPHFYLKAEQFILSFVFLKVIPVLKPQKTPLH